ncbi:MAG: TetR/AcrR family transcriptional regulator [Pseudodesulfovibrio sp.]|nr:TetR/AcrR family transcriptional regulator [Pseudodesulfovibrio sp.]
MTKREMIFNAGAKLFAERAYDSVGIRDIAGEVGVNSAMLSYYFGGKVGLLREIFSRYSSLSLAQLKLSLDESSDHYELCEISVRRLLVDARSNRDIYLVGLREFNRGAEELKDLVAEMREKSWEIFSANLDRLGIKGVRDEKVKDVTFTAVMSMIFSDYLLGGGAFIDNDENIEIYIQVIAEVLKYGMPRFWG